VAADTRPRPSSPQTRGLIPPPSHSLLLTPCAHRCLLVAIDNALKVVNVQTGQIIRSIRSRSQLTSIADFAIDPSNEFRVLVAYSSPRIEVYDWTDGLLITVPIPRLAHKGTAWQLSDTLT